MTPQERAAAVVQKWQDKITGYTGGVEDDIAAAIERAVAEALEQATQIHLAPPETPPAHLGGSDHAHFGYVFGYQDGQVAFRQAIRDRARKPPRASTEE